MPVTPSNRSGKRKAPPSKEEERLRLRKKREAEYIALLQKTPSKRYGSKRQLGEQSTRPIRRLAVDTDSEDEEDSGSDITSLQDSSSDDDSESEVEEIRDATFSEDQGGSSDDDTAVTSEEESDSDAYSSEDEYENNKRRRHGAVPFTPTKRQRQGMNSTTTTPRKREKILENVTSTPHLPARPLNMTTLEVGDLVDLSPQARAKKLLHVGATPERLPCRAEQYDELVRCIKRSVQDGNGRCVYVSGVPGVGKTATIREAIRSLRHQAENEVIAPFNFVEINGMKLNDAQDAYSLLWQTLSGSRCPNRVALRKLSHHFSSASRSSRLDSDDDITTVVLMDELDQLVTIRQEVIYNMFNWPSSNNSRLIVIAVANTMDLPERILNPKVASRLGMKRITFKPYNDKELVEIVHSRLGVNLSSKVMAEQCEVERALVKDCDTVFESDAIVFVSKRVSNVSGDARRMLDVCRRAIDSVEMSTKQGSKIQRVTIADVRKVLDSMVKSGKISHIIKLSLQAKVALISVLGCSRRSGVEENDLGTILSHQRTLCHMQAIPCKLDLNTISSVMAQLCSLGLLIAVGTGAGTGKSGKYARFLLACQEDEVRLALEQDQDPQLRNMICN